MVKHNRRAWVKKVEEVAMYTKPVSKEIIEESKSGKWEIIVTTKKSVPRNWFPTSLSGLKVTCLASGGGQQGPVLAAAGAEVAMCYIHLKQSHRKFPFYH
jgi:hypothetical protein